jgi:NADH-quinone oxidoreductase subunit J
MELFDIVFYCFAFFALAGGVVVVFSRNIMYAAFALLFAFFGIAGFYVLLHADFLAITQVLIYIGGILVLMLFGVMLTNKVVNVDMKTGTLQIVPAMIVAAVVGGSLAGIFYSTWSTAGAVPPDMTTSTPAIGTLLMTSYLLPFEIASVVLLVALIGAALVARRRD